MPNIDVLDQALTFISDHPEQHKQDKWVCGTGGCLAGWGAMLNGWAQIKNDRIRVIPIENKAAAEAARVELSKFPLMDPEWSDASREYRNTLNALGARSVKIVAMEIFGIDSATANILFGGTNTIDKLKLMGKDIANGVDLNESWLRVATDENDNPVYEQVNP
jgi:hypothetical protein